MRLFWGTRADPYHPAVQSRIYAALTDFVDECCGTLARLLVYVGILALLAIVCIHLWDQLPAAGPDSSAGVGWSPATRSYPAFAVSQPELVGKTASYEILRQPDGGRKDILRWYAAGEKQVAELEIYRPGGELTRSGPAIAEIAERMDRGGAHALEAAGVIDSKFGTISLLRLPGAAVGTSACLGFISRFDHPDLLISGWSCQGDTLPARRAAVGCILNRLTLLNAGNDPQLAEFFARAELRRGSCAAPPASAGAVTWVTDSQDPRLRGGL
jgi:hypothetical protein